MKRILVFIVLLFIVNTVRADVRLPNIFGDNMVLQRDKPVVIWGWSSPREKIAVQIDSQSKKTTAGRDGKWKVVLDPLKAGGPLQLVVKGKNTIVLNNVLIGEVWICSGQSNMEWRVRSSNDAEAEIAKADHPQIRHIKIPTRIAAEPLDDIDKAVWEICSPETVGSFTAVGYYFARELLEENIPIGLINTSWGGTHIETWISREAFQNSEEFRDMITSMGRINLDSMRKVNERNVLKRIEDLQGPVVQSPETAKEWKELSYSDGSWPAMAVPGVWERKPLGNIDGVVWFRKSFSLPAGMAGEEGMLTLGLIDDADETFVNGIRVGGSTDRGAKRSYTVPADVLREGKNVIAVRIDDTSGVGGFSGEAGDLKIVVGKLSESLAGDWSYQVESLRSGNAGVTPNQFPTLLFNAMINPLIPYTIRGALWYQGESNARRAYQYRKSFPLMINDWRRRWGQGDFPFYFVQLASFNYGNGNSNAGSAWAELREAQALTRALPYTGMVVTTDIGNALDIHPRNKQEVGRRLAALAKRDVYRKDIVAVGPEYESTRKEGNKIIIRFTNTGGELTARDKYGYLKGFEIAGADRKFYYAQAHLEGGEVVVYHEAVRDPIAVRYGWADDAGDCNLYNEAGFPAAPFRTDDWKGITEAGKFNVGLIFQ